MNINQSESELKKLTKIKKESGFEAQQSHNTAETTGALHNTNPYLCV